MSKSSFVQTTFHGGEWSPFFQGRMDHPKYKTGLNVCRNGFPIEEGAWLRRPGSRLLGPTYKGYPAKIYPVAFETQNPYEVEFTDGNIRVLNGNFFVITGEISRVVSISTANPAVVTMQTPMPWATGDEVQFIFDAYTPGTNYQLMRQRTFKITAITPSAPSAWSSTQIYNVGDLATSGGLTYASLLFGNLNLAPASHPTAWQAINNPIYQFSLADAVSGAGFNGSTVVAGKTSVLVAKLRRISTPYTSGSWANARIVQSQDQGVILNGLNQPQMLEINAATSGPAAATVTLSPVTFIDGPYLDPVPNSQATLSGLSGLVTMTVAFGAWSATQSYVAGDYAVFAGVSYQCLVDNINQQPPNATYWLIVPAGTAVTGDPNALIPGFQSTDVGRLVRLFSQPAAWVATTVYTAGAVVFYNAIAYQAVNPVTGLSPDIIPVGAAQLAWEILPTGAQWTWGVISVVSNPTTVTIQIRGVPLLYNIPVPLWRLGAYSTTTGWPASGTFYEGRFWFGGAIENRFDTSTTFGANKDGSINMAPTGVDGTVGDSNGISYTLESKDLNNIQWFEPDHNGLLCGTLGGEWLISASQLSDPITPTSIQAKRVTKYGCANIEPRRTGIALLFVQKFARRVMEMLADVFTGRYTAPHLTEAAKHLTKDGIADLWYQEELAPLVWLRTLANKLVAATYRRISAFTTEVPAFIGWHHHDLGTLRKVESIGVGSFASGLLDTVYMVTNPPSQAYRQVEAFTQMFDEDDSLYDAWFLDGALVPDGMYTDIVAGTKGQRFTGLFYLIGQTVTVFAGGLDVGDFTVDANGTIFVPYGSGVAPVPIEYTKPGAGAYAFTQSYVASIFAQGLTPRNGGIPFTNTYLVITPGPTTLPAHTTVQGFIPTLTTLSGQNDFGATIDWPAKRLFMAGGGNSGLRKFDMTTCAELADPTWATIFGAALTGQINPTWPSNQNGTLYVCPGSSNFGSVASIAESTLAVNFTFGVASGAGPSIVNGLLINSGMSNPLSVCCITANTDWIVSVGVSRHITLNCGLNGSFLDGNNLPAPYKGIASSPWALLYGFLGTVSVAPGASVDANLVIHSDGTTTFNGFNIAIAFILEGTTAPFTAANVYECSVQDGQRSITTLNPDGTVASVIPGFSAIQNPVCDFEFLGSITPSQIDPTWSTFSAVGGAVVDQLDNNLIFIAETTDAVLTKQYIVKVSTTPYNKATFPPCHNDGSQPPNLVATDFGVLWVVPLKSCPGVNDAPYQTNDQSNKGQCKNGLFALLSNTQTVNNSHISPLYVVDTITGKYGVYNVPGVYYTAFGGQGTQCWDDTSNSIIFFGGYDASVPNAISRVNGTGSFASSWIQVFLGTDIINPLNRQCGNGNPTGGYTFTYNTVTGGFPCVIGVNYVSQGQLLRPALRDDTGVHMGLGFGKTRRTNRFAIQLKNTQSLQVGVDFGATLFPVYFKDDGGNQLPPTVTYSGIWRDTIADGYDFDSMLSWQILRPYPAAVIAYGGFIDTTDV